MMRINIKFIFLLEELVAGVRFGEGAATRVLERRRRESWYTPKKKEKNARNILYFIIKKIFTIYYMDSLNMGVIV